MRMLLADDHVLFRDALKSLIERSRPDIEVLTDGTLGEAIELARQTVALDLSILDLKMPGMMGVDGVEKMRHERPDVPVMALSTNGQGNQTLTLEMRVRFPPGSLGDTNGYYIYHTNSNFTWCLSCTCLDG